MSEPQAYYNENDPKAAAWLRELERRGHIAPGFVDERSIEDVAPADLLGFTQCHFFAGIGVWSYALRRAGWPDDRPVWTGSCPCQPFSAAGKGGGFDDERHLWPAWFWLIAQCRPAILVGEQVASKDADPWLDLVQSDMESLGHAFGVVPFPSAGVGAPHIRERTYWASILVGDAQRARLEGLAGHGDRGAQSRRLDTPAHGPIAAPSSTGLVAVAQGEPGRGGFQHIETPGKRGPIVGNGGPVGGWGAGAVNGLWRNADWLLCRDGKWRPVEPGTFPLAHGAPARVGRLRGYGNAINAEAATLWLETLMATIDAPAIEGAAR